VGRTQKEYYKANKEHLTQCFKAYRKVNKDHLAKVNKKYREVNKEYISQKNKEYYKNNYEAISAYNNTKIICPDCGRQYCRQNKATHERSKKHQLSLQQGTESNVTIPIKTKMSTNKTNSPC
jgi:hypothetical protein